MNKKTTFPIQFISSSCESFRESERRDDGGKRMNKKNIFCDKSKNEMIMENILEFLTEDDEKEL